jgi:hypothetical protein
MPDGVMLDGLLTKELALLLHTAKRDRALSCCSLHSYYDEKAGADITQVGSADIGQVILLLPCHAFISLETGDAFCAEPWHRGTECCGRLLS